MSAPRSKSTTAADILWVMNTVPGRRFAYWLIDGVCGLHAASYAGGREDTFYREGRRAVGIELMLAAQDSCPALYRQMLVEALGDKELNKESAKADEDVDSEEEVNHG